MMVIITFMMSMIRMINNIDHGDYNNDSIDNEDDNGNSYNDNNDNDNNDSDNDDNNSDDNDNDQKMMILQTIFCQRTIY